SSVCTFRYRPARSCRWSKFPQRPHLFRLRPLTRLSKRLLSANRLKLACRRSPLRPRLSCLRSILLPPRRPQASPPVLSFLRLGFSAFLAPWFPTCAVDKKRDRSS